MRLVQEGAEELIRYIEKLAGQTWIDVPRAHVPIRKALTVFDGPGSGWGARIPFQVYSAAIKQMVREHSGIKEPEDALGDAENDSFQRDVESMQSDGMSLEDAISTVAGGENLDMLAEGALQGFVDMIKSLLPALPLPDGFLDPAGAASDFMKQGLVEAMPQSDFLNKLSPGWRYLQKKVSERSHNKVVGYAQAYALKQAGTNPAKLWEAWAMYPTLLGISTSAKQYADVAREVSPGNFEVDTQVDSLFDTTHNAWFDYVRQAAVLLSNQMSTAVLCCFLAYLVNLDDLQAFVTRARAILNAVKQFNFAGMNVLNQAAGTGTSQLENQLAGAVMASLNNNFRKQVEFLREIFQKIEDQLRGIPCIPIDDLFNGLIGILTDVKNRTAAKLRSLIQIEDASWRANINSQGLLIEASAFGRYEVMLSEVEKLVSFAARCQLDQEAVNRRATDIVKRIRTEDRGLNVHVRGTPLPPGLDPESPLANLEPVTTRHGLVVEPGIQGLDLPTGELEDLFRQCRRGTIADGEFFKKLTGVFRRRT